MRKILIIGAALICAGSALAADKPTRFWNLTANTISEFYLAKSGTTNWSANLTKSDTDGTVDHDERLKMPDIRAGYYDAKFVDTKGRSCFVSGVKIVEGKVFSIEEKDLKDCKPKS